jgi:signal transduction histidine kinase
VQRVQTLVDGLLAFARAGGKPEPGTTAAIATVLPDAIDGLAAQARDHEIALRLGPVLEGTLACSTGVLTSLVTNLVQNAIKYMGDSPQRRIDVRVVDAGASWRLEVSDTGPGIPHGQQERIFEPYVRMGQGRPGIGLGLATVDRLVRAHGGQRGVLSQPGEGATFWFELPKG